MNDRLWSTIIVHLGVVAVAFIAAITEAAEPSKSPLIIQVPLHEGLTIGVAYSDPQKGDYETLHTITKVDTRAVSVTISTDQPTSCSKRLGKSRSIAHRSILREDLARAHAYYQGTTACTLEPVINPGMTGLSFSRNVLQELKAKGKTNLSLTEDGKEMFPSVLTRVETESVPFKLILNDEPVEVATVHALWHSEHEFWILDNAENPLVLRLSYNGNIYWDVVKLSFPTDATAARIEQDLSKQGRTVVYGVYFDFASDSIKEESELMLREIADVMTKNPAWRLAVEGHTDNFGGTEANLQLSQRRAAAVAKALGERYKIPSTRLEPAGFGETKPKATNETLEGRALNRRVELVRIGR